MRRFILLVLFAILAIPSFAQQDDKDGPTNDKAKKTYQDALNDLHQRMEGVALYYFTKADKQDGGHCSRCQQYMIEYGPAFRKWKDAETAGEEMVAEARTSQELAIAHFNFGTVLMREALVTHDDKVLGEAHQEMTRAQAASPNFPSAVFRDGLILAHLNQEADAKAQFEQFVKMKSADELSRRRALRYISEPALARARMAPPFSVTIMDGQTISLDEMEGKVVLINFWAARCALCRENIRQIKKIARNFQGEPLVILSVSLDNDEQEWKDNIAKNEMSWPQYRDGGFTGPMATSFEVHIVPQTFTIDADGVLQDQRISDEWIEGKLKKLVAHARELQSAQTEKQ